MKLLSYTVVVVLLTLVVAAAYEREMAPPPDFSVRACVSCPEDWYAVVAWGMKPTRDGGFSREGYVAYCAPR